MKKLIPLLLIIVCNTVLCQFITAQNVKFQMGPEYKLAKITEIPNRFVYGDNTCSYLLRNNVKIGSVYAAAYAKAYTFGLAKTKIKSTVSIEKYDSKFNLAFNKDLSTNIKDLKFEDLMWCKDKFISFTSNFDKNAKTNTAYGNTMDASGNLNPKAVTLMKMEVDSKRKQGAFDFVISDDSTKILVYAFPPSEKNDNQKIAFEVYNNNLEKQWEKIITMPYKDKLVDIEDYTISNNGDVFILVKKYDGEVVKQSKKGENGREANYKYMVLAYLNQGSDTKEYTIDLNGKFVVDPTFKLDPKGNLAFAGFYRDKVGGSEKGIFYMTIDADSKAVKTLSTKEFTKEMIEAFGKSRGEVQKHGKDAGLHSFRFRNFILRDDGGAVLLAENHFVVVITHTSKTGTYTTYEYYYNDIIAINVDNKGNIEWFTRIPKSQVAGADLPSFSFAPLVVGSKIYLVYNDNIKNMQPSNDKWVKRYIGKNGVAVLASIDANGKVEKKLLFNSKDKDTKTTMMTKLSRQITPNSMAIYMQLGKKYHIGSISIN